MEAIADSVKKTNRCLVLTEEPLENSFAMSLAGQIASECFDSLDAAPSVLGSVSLPAIPLNSDMESEVLPNAEKVSKRLEEILNF